MSEFSKELTYPAYNERTNTDEVIAEALEINEGLIEQFLRDPNGQAALTQIDQNNQFRTELDTFTNDANSRMLQQLFTRIGASYPPEVELEINPRLAGPDGPTYNYHRQAARTFDRGSIVVHWFRRGDKSSSMVLVRPLA